MLGQRFRLRRSMAAIGLDDAFNRVVVSIPAGAELTVVESRRDHAPWVKVSWNGRFLETFLVDLQKQAEPVGSMT
jgi:hypothetical protein